MIKKNKKNNFKFISHYRLMKKPLIAGNWKMNKTLEEAVTFVSELRNRLKDVTDRDILLVPPYIALQSISEIIKGTNLLLGAQNLFWENEGAYTGEISPGMIKSVGCSHIIIGHSERRQYFGETNDTVNLKVKAALKNGLLPLVCIGESLEEREANKTFNVIDVQIREGLKDFSSDEIQKIIIAYEPVWAIGTGKTATPEQANEVHSFIKKTLKKIYGNGILSTIRILYGGSVKPDNIDELMAKEDIDGALVGGASLKVDDFERIVKFK
jgi:triosephosphate isomerase